MYYTGVEWGGRYDRNHKSSMERAKIGREDLGSWTQTSREANESRRFDRRMPA